MVTQEFIFNSWALPYLNGVAYVTAQGVFFWENGRTTQLSTNGKDLAVDGNILAWFSGFNETSTIQFYDGEVISEIPLNINTDQFSLKLLDGTSFIFSGTDFEGSTRSLIKGTHGFIPQIDQDNDGFTSDVDCNDNNFGINPNAFEIPNNEIDENCDGIAQIITQDNLCTNTSTSIIAGAAFGQSSIDGSATTATFNRPEGVAVDQQNNIYVSDTKNHTIRKITPNGSVTTFAGQAGVAGYVDGTSSMARFNSPSDIGVDAAGFIYVSDTENHVIRKITPDGQVSTLAGSGSRGRADGIGRSAAFSSPQGIDVDPVGNVYVADNGNVLIRKVSANGTVLTLAGTPNTRGNVNGLANSAVFGSVDDVAIDLQTGEIYIVDLLNFSIRRLTPNCQVELVAGAGQRGPSSDGVGAEVYFISPSDLVVDHNGNIYVVDNSGSLRRVTREGVVTSIYKFDQSEFIQGLTIDPQGNIVLSDFNSSRIKRLNNCSVSTLTLNGGVVNHCGGSLIIPFNDLDNDGYTSDVDCDDNNASINPGVIEITNSGFDENCDGISLIIDNDNDGFNSSIDCDDNNAAINAGAIEIPNNGIDEDCNGTDLVQITDNDNDGFAVEVDCNDNNASINPGAAEIANSGFDENCDGISLIIDNDNDGFNSSIDCDDNNASVNTGAIEIANNGIDEDCNGSDLVTVFDNDNDGFTNDVDCNDNNASINPGAAEVANSGFDENCDGVSLIIDNDNDGFNSSIDCDDNNASVNSGATEIANNGIDEDCNGSDLVTVFDNDNDGFTNDVDCNDNNAAINPGAAEIANSGFDENCDGESLIIDNDNDGFNSSIDCDDNNASINAGATEIANNGIDEDCNGSDLVTVFDNDNDGFTNDVDCNDNNAAINPGAAEIANSGLDENCDGVSLIIDNDNDGFNSSIDCDDNNASINTGATEIANNGIDEDCNGSDLVTIEDRDNDGYDTSVDCNDQNSFINPGREEITFNGVDENCDGRDFVQCSLTNPLEEIPLLKETVSGRHEFSYVITTIQEGQLDGATYFILDRGDRQWIIDCVGNFITCEEDCTIPFESGVISTIWSNPDTDQDGFLLLFDCNDNNAAINPDAVEIANSGFDEKLRWAVFNYR